MTPRLELSGLKKAAWWEHALRFLFGGLVTVAAGLVAKRWGPGVGGLFLAFPAILPASLTLVKRHDGREACEDDALGSKLGAIGLAAFAIVVAAIVGHGLGAPLTLLVALVAWSIVSAGLWALVHGRRPEPPRHRSGR